MRRRGHKSTKVPNVKLRPVPSASRSSTPSSNYWVQDTQVDADSSLHDLCPRPFQGVVVCATGVPDKPTLFKQALELGATSATAFTDKVTHLVAEDHGGAKYMCALKRRIPILRWSWITESYKTWLRGDDVDLHESIRAHRLPVFSGVILSLSGIEADRRRTKIHKLLTEHGGTYVKDLERPVRVTHLLCSGDTETEKMRYADKFNKSGEAKIWMIWEEWFWDSLEFGGRFEEEEYSVGQPRPERKITFAAANSIHGTQNSSDSHISSEQTPEDKPETNRAPLTSGDRPAPALQDLEDEPASVKRPVPAEILQLWQTLLKPRGYEISQGQLMKTKSNGVEEPLGVEKLDDGVDHRSGSIVGAFRRASSSARGIHKETTTPLSGHQPFRRQLALSHPERAEFLQPSTEHPSRPVMIFAGMTFRALGEAKCPALRTEVESCGGRMVESEDVGADFIIVRLVSGSKLFREERDESERCKYRTECWLERCVFEERVCMPEEHISFLPLDIETPIPGAETVNLSCSGLDESEMCWMKRMARALGIALAPNFNRRCSHLFCPMGKGAKYDKAIEWNIPVVGTEWVNRMVKEGIVPNGFGYEGPDTLLVKLSDKGKEKENVNDSERIETTKSREGLSIRSTFPQGNNSPLFLSSPSSPGGQTSRQMSASATPPRSSQTTAVDPFALPSGSDSGTPTYSEPHNIERDKDSAQIPSSNTPSPLKIPGDAVSKQNFSPIKVPNEVTKALQDTITNLLGKRSSGEESHPKRTGKKGRLPVKLKSSSRRNTKPTRSAQIDMPEFPPLSQTLGSTVDNDPGDLNSTEENMRVVYEDPEQRNEQQRLMSLLDNQMQASGVDAPKAGKKSNTSSKRRSARVAGF